MSTSIPPFRDWDHLPHHGTRYLQYDHLLYVAHQIAQQAHGIVEAGLHTYILDAELAEPGDEEAAQVEAVIASGFDLCRARSALTEIAHTVELALAELALLDRSDPSAGERPDDTVHDAYGPDDDLNIILYGGDEPTEDE